MIFPRSYFFPIIALLGLLFFTFSDGVVILPVEYVHLMFGFFALFLAPFFLRRKVDRKSMIAALVLFALGVASSIGSGVPSAFVYSVGPIMLLAACSGQSVRATDRHRLLFAKWLTAIIVLSSLAALPFFEKSWSGRYFLSYVGNPNYTAMLYLAAFVSVQLAAPQLPRTDRKILSATSYVIFFAVLALTQTRSATLAFVVFLLFSWAIKRGKVRLAKNLATLLVIFTVIGQLLAFYVFSHLGASDARSTFSVFDASNLRRVEAFYAAFLMALNDPNFLWYGLGNVDGIWAILATRDGYQNVPHNWFMIMWLSNGVLFTFACLAILIIATRKLPPHYLPGLAALLIIALIVGRAVLFAPLCLFLVVGMIQNRVHA